MSAAPIPVTIPASAATFSPAANDYTRFTQAVATLIPLRLECYKRQQMERRIRDFARKHGAPTLDAFAEMVRADRALLRAFEQHLTINVSEFFRNPEAFAYLADRVLPDLLTPRPGELRRGPRVWSAGCSYGAEAYTIAMLLREQAPTVIPTIMGSDIDRDILVKAKGGRDVTEDDLRGMPRRLRDRYVSRDGPPYAIAAEITRMVRFERHDLLHDPAPRAQDLIACRNVVIYFTDEAKARLYSAFVDALRPGGYLFIGATEVITGSAELGLRYVAPCFYRKEER